MNPAQAFAMLQLLADLRLQLGEVTADLERVKAERDQAAADLRTVMENAAEPAMTNGDG